MSRLRSNSRKFFLNKNYVFSYNNTYAANSTLIRCLGESFSVENLKYLFHEIESDSISSW